MDTYDLQIIKSFLCIAITIVLILTLVSMLDDSFPYDKDDE